MFSKTWIIVIVLLLAGVGLIVYSNGQKAKTGDKNTKQIKSTVANSSKQETQRPLGVNIGQLLSSTPGVGATQDQIKAHSEAVSKVAADSATLDISSCSPNPPVLLVKGQKKFTIKNSDSATHILNHSKGINFVVEGKGQKEVNMPITIGPGTYGYTCDNKVAGIFLITP